MGPYATPTLKACLIAGSALLSACQPDTPAAEQSVQSPPMTGQMTAFRSVLDGKPRVLTLRLGDDLSLAYDTDAGTLFKVWDGQVEFSGAVYDQKHGPQPATPGRDYLKNENVRWQGAIEFKGHRLNGNTPTLLYAGDGINIEETPGYQMQGEQAVVTRQFVVTGGTASLSGLQLPQNHSVSGTGELNGDRLILKPGTTELTLHYSALPQASEQANGQNDAPAEAEQHPGEALIAGSDCAACHNPEVKTVGPSYASIAQRYINESGAREMLAQKIIDGGAGNWGQIPMTPHPSLSAEDAATMVDYIFTLAPAAEPVADGANPLAQPAVAVNLKDTTPELNENAAGALFYLHYFSGDQPNVDVLRNTPPALAAHSAQIHLPDIDAFEPIKERFAYQVKTNLKLDKPLQTTLRLVSDDGSYLYLNGELAINHWGFHGPDPMDATIDLEAGLHPLEIIYFQGTSGAALSLQWKNPATGKFELIPESMLVVTPNDLRTVEPVVTDPDIVKTVPGDMREVAGVHPSFDLHQARPEEFEPMVGGLDFLPDGRLVVSTWDPEGSVYIVSGWDAAPENIQVKRIARGLAEPLGLKVVDGDIYVLQKQELTRLVDVNGDEIIDEYRLVANDWSVTGNFHEFAFGLEYQDGYFYGALATAILPGGASADPQAPDRGHAFKVNKSTGEVTMIASGLRTPNGIGFGIDEQLFIADNQGDWIPSSKIIELTEGAWYGSRSVDFAGTENLTETLPVVWLPQDEIGNSPSEPAPLNLGPYQNQMIHGEVTHGGIKRVFAERINGRLQGAVFRFTQGLEAGVNRLQWAPDGSLIVGGVGNPGNWAHAGGKWYGLQRLNYNGNTAFEMLSVSARSDGFEITFTEPVAAGQNITAEDFEVIQWRYEPTSEYGGPKLDKGPLKVEAFSLSQDRRRAQFKLAGLKENHLVYFRIKRGFVSESENELWTTEAWYTLNAIPANKPVAINTDYQPRNNRLSEAEKTDGWQLLFDGKTLNGLRNYNSDQLGERWVVDNGALHLTGRTAADQGWKTPGGGDVVITPAPVENFELYLEWKLAEDGNSGILYKVKETPELEHSYQSGPEYQLLDNPGHPDGKIEKHRAGDLYDLIKSKFVTVLPAGQWNRTRLVVNNGKIEHWLNGYKLVQADTTSPEWQQLIGNSKFADWPEFANNNEGHIVLQDHGDKVWFRNIKLKPL
ncbi:family 16 glycoside hydrolase [Gilvimarinus chinensis]|uniref:family 16 glycoside hydrolase n=1 Tax=Gilvimarinus chinensis TaxID=396005 RepID=UPI00037BF7BD|nr:family 16 glycoside hydrolase [Gilvimarinus chinensis]